MELWKILALAVPTIYFCFQANFVAGLECYVCSNQTGNVEKCLNTIKTCEPGEDVCGTEIRWGSQPYFSQGAKKQHYVSKRCMTKKQCLLKRKNYMRFCTHVWYEDWACAECCQGDRCNFYIISGTTILKSSLLEIFTMVGVLMRLFY